MSESVFWQVKESVSLVIKPWWKPSGVDLDKKPRNARKSYLQIFSTDPGFLESAQVMKSKSLRDKFKILQVKPLYRKAKPKNVLVTVHSTYNLDGDDLTVKRQICDVVKDKTKGNRRKNSILPGQCQSGSKTVFNKVYNLRNNELKGFTMIENAGNSELYDSNGNKKVDQHIQADKLTTPNISSDTWLRVYPLPQEEKESICSTVLRCLACQFGLASMLVLWTLVWVFVINYFEGPYELKVTQDFEREQNQLVIDLATELRQITPVSPKWREAIERRIQEERQLTILAVGRGARAHPGQFWDLPGTFLFTIYVMTALGFGAPVPHTICGRSATLVYAFIAIPAHIYLMVNVSTCAVAVLSASRCPLKSKQKKRTYFMEDRERNTIHNTTDSPNYSRNSAMLKTSKCESCRRKIMRCLCVLIACRCVPAAALLYYTCGAVAFGVLRRKTAVETVMFPLEFTTTGGLEHVVGHVRIFYGFYVEGAMVLLSYALATLRRISNASVSSIAERYRLFQVAT